jgi:N6-L-threonylcarbamoyladenine synthase
MLVLGIESSCDDTAAAVVDERGCVHSDVVHSQVALHREYGGVVPELASRDHVAHIGRVTHEALTQAGVTLKELGAVAVTCSPGLSGALLVGLQMARGLCWASGLPVRPVDHLVGHLLSPFLHAPGEPEATLQFPYVALLVSGGHTAVYAVRGAELQDITELGATRDDAAGEAFDKLAKLVGLGYPGGPIIDRLAREGDPHAIALAQPMRGRLSPDFSFSGLKSDVARWVERNGPPGNNQTLRDLCAAFQDRVVSALLNKTFQAARTEGIGRVVLVGGVASNRELRQRASEMANSNSVTLDVPIPARCTDNGAMIAYAGHFCADTPLDALTISPETRLSRRTRKGRGRRPK